MVETEYFPTRGISNSKFDIKCFNSLTGQAFEDFSFLYRLNSDHQPYLGFFVGSSSIRSSSGYYHWIVSNWSCRSPSLVSDSALTQSFFEVVVHAYSKFLELTNY